MLGTLSIDDEWDVDDLPEVARASWPLLHILACLASSSERE